MMVMLFHIMDMVFMSPFFPSRLYLVISWKKKNPIGFEIIVSIVSNKLIKVFFLAKKYYC